MAPKDGSWNLVRNRGEGTRGTGSSRTNCLSSDVHDAVVVADDDVDLCDRDTPVDVIAEADGATSSVLPVVLGSGSGGYGET
jgi:hypothetical protein